MYLRDLFGRTQTVTSSLLILKCVSGKAQTDGWVQTMQELQTAVIAAGGWSWAWFLPAKPASVHKQSSNCLWFVDIL